MIKGCLRVVTVAGLAIGLEVLSDMLYFGDLSQHTLFGERGICLQEAIPFYVVAALIVHTFRKGN